MLGNNLYYCLKRNGKSMEICVCVPETLCFTSEANTTLQLNYNSRKKKNQDLGGEWIHVYYGWLLSCSHETVTTLFVNLLYPDTAF